MEEVVRGKNQKCTICQKKFTIFNPEHVCKRCLRSVCKGCADNRAPIFEKGGERKMHRLCTKCMPETQFLENYKNCYKVVFNTGCKMGNSWADELAKASPKKSDSSYPKIKKPPLKPKPEFWSDLNFSLRNFFGLCIQTTDFYPTLKSLYDKLLLNNLSEHICLFFLCHCSQSKAYQSILSIYNILQHQPADLDRVFANLKYFGCSQKEMSTMRPFVESLFTRFVNGMSLNVVTAEVSLFIISAFIREKTTRVLEKGLATALFILKDFICTHSDRKVVENQFVLNIRFNQFESNMKIMDQKDKVEKQSTVQRNNSVVQASELIKHKSDKSDVQTQEVTRAQSVLVAPQTYKPQSQPTTQSSLSSGRKQDQKSSSRQDQSSIDNSSRKQSQDHTLQSPVRGFTKPSTNPPPPSSTTTPTTIFQRTPQRTTSDAKNIPPPTQTILAPVPTETPSRTTSDAKDLDSTLKPTTFSDDDDFDEDLKKLYEENQKILVQTKALKRLGEQLLKEIQEM